MLVLKYGVPFGPHHDTQAISAGGAQKMGMRVLLAPFFEENQYLELLESALEDAGIEVERSTTARPLAMPLLDAVRADADVFHLHWTHPYFLFGSYERFYRIPGIKYVCWVFALFFLVQVYLATLVCDRVVWTVHNKCNHERRYEDLDNWVSRRVFGMADAVQVWDENTKRELADYLNVSTEKIVAIPHGNYLPLYPPEDRPSKEKARSTLGLPQDERVFLYFGMIRPYKQVPELLDVWTDIDPNDAHLVIAGNPKYDYLADAIQDRACERDDVTTDLRYVPDDEVPTYFSACDVAVFPYEHIFSSGSVVLAMSMGQVFVAPEMGAIPSLDSGGNVVYQDLQEGLNQLLAIDERALLTVRQQNLQIAKSELDWGGIVEEFNLVYHRY